MALAESTMPMSVQLIAVVNLLLSLGGLYKAHTIKLEIEEAEQDEG